MDADFGNGKTGRGAREDLNCSLQWLWTLSIRLVHVVAVAVTPTSKLAERGFSSSPRHLDLFCKAIKVVIGRCLGVRGGRSTGKCEVEQRANKTWPTAGR